MIRLVFVTATALASLSLAAAAADLKFSAIQAPSDDAAKRTNLVSAEALINGQIVPLGYHIIARSGDKIGGGVIGQLTDAKGNSLEDPDSVIGVSVSADFTSLIPVGKKLFMVGHFESRPGAMNLTELKQESDGNLTAIATKPIDFSAVGGLWNPCAGVVTPWNTHLGSEEYPSDARKLESAKDVKELKDEAPMASYFGLDPKTMSLDAFKAVYNPYRYGFSTEIAVSDAGDAKVAKHYAMGRFSVELANIMPDKRTAYMSDDGTNVGFFKFVADKEGDLSSGKLFAAKWNQTSDAEAGSAKLDWIDLGAADDKSVNALIAKGTRFSDIFETATISPSGLCPDGFKGSNAEGRSECLKVKAGMDVAASRLETRRYASMLGATTEFRKMEGSALDAKNKIFYLSMTEISNGMEDYNIADKGGRNDIRLKKNVCGAVYGMKLDDNWNISEAFTAVNGREMKYEASSPWAGSNDCDINGIANPDNITFIPNTNIVIIGEDTTKGHQNDAVWAFDVKEKALTRIMTTVYGAEATSVDYYTDINGYGYLMAVVQHPYGESDQDKLKDKADARAYIGYIGPFPVIK